MTRVNHWVLAAAAFALAVVAGGYALLGVGLAAILAVGFVILAALVIPGIVVYEEEAHLPLAEKARRR